MRLCHRAVDFTLDPRKRLPAREYQVGMEKDSDQCQPDCDCGRSALVSVAYFFASANREHTQQRRKYDWTYGNAAGRHGNRRGSAEKVFCTLRNYLPVVLRLLVVPVIVLLLLRVVHAAGWISDGKAILMTVYLSAITPSCATVTSMAQLYNRDAAHSSALYVLSTLLSIFTMPLMIGLFEVLI